MISTNAKKERGNMREKGGRRQTSSSINNSGAGKSKQRTKRGRNFWNTRCVVWMMGPGRRKASVKPGRGTKGGTVDGEGGGGEERHCR